jgi:hypothetical protein
MQSALLLPKRFPIDSRSDWAIDKHEALADSHLKPNTPEFLIERNWVLLPRDRSSTSYQKPQLAKKPPREWGDSLRNILGQGQRWQYRVLVQSNHLSKSGLVASAALDFPNGFSTIPQFLNSAHGCTVRCPFCCHFDELSL